MKKNGLIIALLIALLALAPACKKEEEDMDSKDTDLPQTDGTVEESTEEGAIEPVIGQCNNVLHPFNVGNNWVYTLDSFDEEGNPTNVEYAWSVSESTDAGITLGTLFYDSGTVVTASLDCKDGMIQNFPVSISNVVIGDTEGSIQYEHISGQYLPSELELEAGNWQNSWQTVANSSGTISAGYEGETTTIMLEDSPIIMNWQILEKDVSVTVLAGTFDNAIVVNQEMIYEIKSLKIDSGDLPIDVATTIKTNSDYWFVPNLGLVKTEIKSATINLFGSEFPWEATGGSELKSSNLLEN